jgi:hypothetical protein
LLFRLTITRNILIANMFRLDDRTDEGSQGIEERLRRGGLIRDERRRTDFRLTVNEVKFSVSNGENQ